MTKREKKVQAYIKYISSQIGLSVEEDTAFKPNCNYFDVNLPYGDKGYMMAMRIKQLAHIKNVQENGVSRWAVHFGDLPLE